MVSQQERRRIRCKFAILLETWRLSEQPAINFQIAISFNLASRRRDGSEWNPSLDSNCGSRSSINARNCVIRASSSSCSTPSIYIDIYIYFFPYICFRFRLNESLIIEKTTEFPSNCGRTRGPCFVFK